MSWVFKKQTINALSAYYDEYINLNPNNLRTIPMTDYNDPTDNELSSYQGLASECKHADNISETDMYEIDYHSIEHITEKAVLFTMIDKNTGEICKQWVPKPCIFNLEEGYFYCPPKFAEEVLADFY